MSNNNTTKKVGGKRAKSQEERREQIEANNQNQVLLEFTNFIREVELQPMMWRNRRLKFMRDFFLAVKNNPSTYPLQIGDVASEISVNVDHTNVTLTTSYISSLAKQDGKALAVSQPILAVVSRSTGFHDSANLFGGKQQQRVKLTQLTLMDNDHNQVHSRMATHLTEQGRNLCEGDIIRLDLFTIVTYQVNKESSLFPAILIQRFTRVGHDSLPPQDEISSFIACTKYKDVSMNDEVDTTNSSNFNIDPRTQSLPACSYEHRLCRKYGVNFIARCICDEIPPADQDLTVIAEDCYLITQPFEKLQNRSKRLMLYWWYATNVYSLSGKGHRGKLPDCLEYAIKKHFPPEDNEEEYTQFKTTKKYNKK